VRARLILLKRESGGWAREGQTLAFDDEEGQTGETGDEKAEAHGKEWVRQDPSRRDYTVLRRKPPPERPRRIE
jgi:hypothetical protein